MNPTIRFSMISTCLIAGMALANRTAPAGIPNSNITLFNITCDKDTGKLSKDEVYGTFVVANIGKTNPRVLGAQINYGPIGNFKHGITQGVAKAVRSLSASTDQPGELQVLVLMMEHDKGNTIEAPKAFFLSINNDVKPLFQNLTSDRDTAFAKLLHNAHSAVEATQKGLRHDDLIGIGHSTLLNVRFDQLATSGQEFFVDVPGNTSGKAHYRAKFRVTSP